MANMTLRRLDVLKTRACQEPVSLVDLGRYAHSLEQRRRERGPSKLSRRLSRKRALGRSGAF